MGKYINQTSNGFVGTSANAKALALIQDGAQAIPKPKEFGPNLVCVVDNGIFGAAAYCYSEGEFKAFTDPSDTRPTKWFIWDKVEKFAQ
jgi:hypothetical protein